MQNAWTPERKAKQAAAIQNWMPWQKSTGPKSLRGKTKVSCNAFKGGHRPKLRAAIHTLNLELNKQRVFLASCRKP